MSDAGTAIFNHNIKLPDNGGVTFGAGSDLSIYSDGTNGVVNVTNGDLTLDVVGDIILDVDGAEIFLKDGGVQFASFYQNSNNFYIQSSVSDKDIIFQGNDGGTGFTALTLDMSDAGKATFNNGLIANGDISLGDNKYLLLGNANDLQIYHDGSHSYMQNNTGYLHVNTANFEVKNTANNETMILATQNGAVTLKYDNATKLATIIKWCHSNRHSSRNFIHRRWL